MSRRARINGNLSVWYGKACMENVRAPLNHILIVFNPMDTAQLQAATERLGEMLRVSREIDSLPPVLQEAVRESLLQRFEYTVETSWKTAKRYLTEIEGFASVMGPRTVLRMCGELGLLDPEEWLGYLDTRQFVSHDYSAKKADAVLAIVKPFHREALRLTDALNARIGPKGA